MWILNTSCSSDNAISQRKKKKRKEDDWKHPTEIRGGFHCWRPKAPDSPQSRKTTVMTEACGHEQCGARGGVFIPATWCSGNHKCEDAAPGQDKLMEIWSYMSLLGCSSALGRFHTPDCWKLDEILLHFPHFCALRHTSAAGGMMLPRWIIELTSPDCSSITHSCVEPIWTEKVVEIYGGNLIKSKQTKYKSCLYSLNLNVSAEDNPVSSRIHHILNRLVVIYLPWFIHDLRRSWSSHCLQTHYRGLTSMTSFWPKFKLA